MHQAPRRLLFAILLSSLLLPCSTMAAKPHPHDGLSADEINKAVAALRSAGELVDGSLLISLDLVPPNKTDVLAWRKKPESSRLPARQARAIVRTSGRSAQRRW